ncbi:MAG: NAD(P) transhydrogenase subunit alpha [Phycisphaerales bacterium]
MELNAATLSLLFFVFVLAMFLGVELIRRVPSQLHTPLMSGSNAVSGITIVGSLLALGHPDSDAVVTALAAAAAAFATINVVGGYLVTDRMLGMFRGKRKDGGKT